MFNECLVNDSGIGSTTVGINLSEYFRIVATSDFLSKLHLNI